MRLRTRFLATVPVIGLIASCSSAVDTPPAACTLASADPAGLEAVATSEIFVVQPAPHITSMVIEPQRTSTYALFNAPGRCVAPLHFGSCFVSLAPAPGASCSVASLGDPGVVTVAASGTQRTLRTTDTAFTDAQRVWSSGQTLEISVRGSALIEDFSGSVAMPFGVTVTRPALPQGRLVIPRSSALSLAWDTACAPIIAVALFRRSDSASTEPAVSIQCWFRSDANTGEIPADALARLPLSQDYALSVSALAHREVTAGTALVRVNAQTRSYYTFANIE